MAKKKEKLKELKKEAKKPDFWKDRERAKEIEKEISDLRAKIRIFEKLKGELEEIEDFLEIAKEDKKLALELEGKILEIEEKIKKESLKVFLSGPYDRGDAVLEIFAGAGGRDAQDWATILQRMYERYCQRRGFKVKILEQAFGEAGGPEGRIGTKHVTLEISGKFAFGFLKREAGVHRLVRISPFSPQKLRHTSFCQVLVLPKLEKPGELEIKILPENLKIETFRASGPGGQYVQKRETAVRITHLPTKMIAVCQSERFQALNKKKAMEILYGKLYQLRQKKFEKEIKKMKGEIKPAWGRQIRSYVLHPYKLVKDLRTKVEISDVEGVLGGNLDRFIESEIKLSQE